MKHPALTQALAIVLAVLSLTMAAAGALGLRSAERERQAVLDDMERLRARAAEYRALADQLVGTVSYAEQSEALEERESQYNRDSAQHRTDLGIFTATRYGINMGTDAIDQADLQFAAVRAKFDNALPAFENGLGELNGLLGALWQLYNTADATVQSAEGHLNTARSFSAYLDSGEELTAAQALAAYDELLAIADETVAMRDTLRSLRPALDTIAAFDPAAVSAMTEQLNALSSSLGAFGSVPVENYQDFDVTVPYDMDQLVQMQQSFSAYWTQAQGLLDALDAAEPVLAQQLEQATGLSVEDLRANAQSARDGLAARGDEPLSEEESEAIRAVYAANSAGIHAALEQAGAGLEQVKGPLAEFGGALSGAQEMLNALNALLATAKSGIQAAADALYQARALIWWQMGQQREKEEALREEKAALEEEAETLQQLSDEAEDQKSLEDRLRSARAALLNREGVSALAEAGQEPDEAALSFAAQQEETSQLAHSQRRRACLLMLAGALGGLLALPGAFAAKNGRLLLAPPVLCCLGCAAAAEWLFRSMGRGDSYSCLGVGVFALLQLLVSLPGKKKRRRRA